MMLSRFVRSPINSVVRCAASLHTSPSQSLVTRQPKLFKNAKTLAFNPRATYYAPIDESYVNEPFSPVAGRFPTWATTKEELFGHLKSNSKIFIHGGAATPTVLLENLYEYAKDANLKDLTMYHIHIEGAAKFTQPDVSHIFRSNSLFTGANLREAVNAGRADYTPIFLSEIPLLFRRKLVQLDMALISVTPPDRHGFCSLGPSVDCTRAAIQNAKFIVAQVNPMLPRTRGDASIHMSHIDVLMNAPMPVHELKAHGIAEEERQIGKIIANNLVADGATLQMGIGSIPDAVLTNLTNHKHLGIHTEMFSDGVVDLVKCGAITNSMKKLRPGKIVSSFVIGTKKVFDFLDNNPFVDMSDVEWVNRTTIIAQNPRVTAINSCIEVDLTGQVVSDSIGTRIYSGVGGQVDFIRGASLSFDGQGKPIIALCSTTRKNETKIVPFLKQGGGVITSRAHVHYVVTEHGIAYLFGKNLRQRAHALINVAHPSHREALEKAAFERMKCMPSAD
jgi:acyl-CoA hydrolase